MNKTFCLIKLLSSFKVTVEAGDPRTLCFLCGLEFISTLGKIFLVRDRIKKVLETQKLKKYETLTIVWLDCVQLICCIVGFVFEPIFMFCDMCLIYRFI